MKIIFVSPFHRGYEHHMFESSILNYYIKTYPKADFLFIGETEHISHILSTIEYPWKTFSIKTQSRNLLIWYTFFQIIRQPKEAKIIYLALDPFYLYFLLTFRKSIDIWFMHKYWRDLTYWYDKFLSFLGLKFFLLTHQSTKIFVLWPWIYQSIQNDSTLSIREKQQFQSILHPYFLSLPAIHTVKRNRAIKFGFIGRQKVSYKKINMQDIILVKSTIIKLGWEVAESHSTDFITNEDYFVILQKSDYILFLAPSNSYEYRCSGVLVEAIVYARPIICLSNPMTDYFFGIFGNIGYKFNTIQQLIDALPKIVTREPHEYRIQQNNLLKWARKINMQEHYSILQFPNWELGNLN